MPLVLVVWEMFEKVIVINGDWWGMSVLVHTLTEFLPLRGEGGALESKFLLVWLPSKDMRPGAREIVTEVCSMIAIAAQTQHPTIRQLCLHSFPCKRGSPIAFPPLIPHLPSWPRGDPRTPFVYQGFFMATRRVLDGWGACSFTQTPWPHGDWILDKVLRPPSRRGQAASAEQILVLLGWPRQSHPKGRGLGVESV